LAGAHVLFDDVRARGFQDDRFTVHHDRPSLQTVQQGRNIGRDDFDHALLQRFGRRQVQRFGHESAGDLLVPFLARGNGSDVGGRVVHHLVGHGVWTGLAEPMFVPGAMAATWAARVMNAPALAARLPLGATNTITGTRAASCSLMMSRMDVSRPPGVSSMITRATAPSLSAVLMLWQPA